ncbi:MAG: hypothetical protein ACPG46_09340 [Thalassotalea sp.]
MKEHGHFTLFLQDNIIVSRFFGAWNIEQTQHYVDHVIDIATTINHSPWARIVDISAWEGGAIETTKPLTLLQQWAEKNNCKHVVFINPPTLPQFMLDKYGQHYGNYKTFTSIDEATVWVKSTLNNAIKQKASSD